MNLGIKFQLKISSRSRDIMILIEKSLSHLIEIVHKSVRKTSISAYVSADGLFRKIPLPKSEGFDFVKIL